MKDPFGVARLLITILISISVSRAGEIPIDITAYVNVPWTYQLLNGSGFPTGNLNFGGVPYSVPTGPRNWWSANYAANGGSGTVSVTIPVGVTGVTSAFTWLNTEYGQPGPEAYLYVTFNWSNGSTTTQIFGGVNVRDYNNDGFQNTINGTSTKQIWDNGLGQRLDRQEYIFPASFSRQVLDSVTITDTGHDNFSRAIFSALTVSTCRAYVIADLTPSAGPIIYHPRSKLYTQDFTLTNDGTTAVVGPLYLIFEDIPAGVTLVRPAALTTCYAPIGSPYLLVLPRGSSLAPGTTEIVHLEFNDPSGVAISYVPLTVSGLAGPP